MIIDATGAILGRLSARAAKQLLSGEDVVIVNADLAVVSGEPRYVCELYRYKKNIGSALHGPYFPKYPDRIIWRTIRGMMPYKQPRGKNALKKLEIHRDQPEKYKNAVKIIKTGSELRCKCTTLKEISKFMGAKIE